MWKVESENFYVRIIYKYKYIQKIIFLRFRSREKIAWLTPW